MRLSSRLAGVVSTPVYDCGMIDKGAPQQGESVPRFGCNIQQNPLNQDDFVCTIYEVLGDDEQRVVAQIPFTAGFLAALVQVGLRPLLASGQLSVSRPPQPEMGPGGGLILPGGRS